MPQETQVSRVKRIDTLQAGRALAALAVLASHVDQSLATKGTPFPHWLSLIAARGYLGVDFFFVLSGFIIYRTNAEKLALPGWSRHYVHSRLHRIYPPYLPIGIAIAIVYTKFPWLSHVERDWSWLPTLTLFPVGQPALSVAWTLQHEMTFYVIMWVLFSTRQVLAGCIIWAALILLVRQSIPLEIINLEFLFGVCAAWLHMNGRGPGNILLLCGSALLFGAFFFLLGDAWRVVFGLAITFAILPLVRAERAGKLHVPSFAVQLGAESYALYLIHLPLVIAVSRVLRSAPWPLAAAGMIAVPIISAKLYYRFYEQSSLLRRLEPKKLARA